MKTSESDFVDLYTHYWELNGSKKGKEVKLKSVMQLEEVLSITCRLLGGQSRGSKYTQNFLSFRGRPASVF